jgi:superfamily II DNA/RNA helicase
MLDMGFMPDVERIVGLLPKIRQTLFFSATMPPEIRRLADAFLMNPKEIAVDPPATAAETVTQTLVRVSGEQKEKRAALRALLRGPEITSALIFCNRKRDVDIVFRSLKRHGFDVAALHGDMAQPVRIETLGRFKAKEVRLLVCSDVAARGLDIPKVSHVINFDVPVHSEDYVHRIGRTGRAGRSGESVTLALPEEAGALSGVNAVLGRPIPEITLEGIAGWAEGDAPKSSGRRRHSRRRRDAGPAKARHERGSAPAKARHERPNAPPKRAAAEKPAEKPAKKAAAGKPAKKTVQKAAANKTPVKPAKKAAANKTPAKTAKKAAGKPAESKSFGGQVPAFLRKPVKVA